MYFIVLSWSGMLKALTETCWSELQENGSVLGSEDALGAWLRNSEEFLMSQSGVKYQDQNGKEGPWWFKRRIFFFWSTSPSRIETICILGQCLMKFLTAGCGGGAACGCLLLPLLKEVEQMSLLGTDYAKKTSTFILEYWSRGKLNYKALKVDEGWGKRRTKLVAALLPCDQCYPSCTSTAWVSPRVPVWLLPGLALL